MAALLTLPPALREHGGREAVSHLRTYFGLDGTRPYTGAYFERLDGGGDRPEVASEITPADIVAVKMLGVDVPAYAALALLLEDDPLRAQIHELLTAIPTDLELVDVDVSRIGPGWPAWELWGLLRTLKGVKWVKAGKIVARKRPKLIPVYDRVVRQVLSPVEGFWGSLALTLQADDRALHGHLHRLREQADVGSGISAIRIFDIVTWMTGQSEATTRK